MWQFKFTMPLAAALLLLQGVAECIRAWGRAFGPDGAGADDGGVDADEGGVIL